jgi:hypothetical protein
MSTEREDGMVTWVCDECGEYSEAYDPDGFGQAWEELRSLGWRAFKNKGDEWEHRCPECRGT